MHISSLIKKAARLLEKEANILLKPYDITHGYTYFLLELFEQEGLTQTELQKRIGMDHSTIVRTLDRMTRDGLIERRSSLTDRRVFQIYLTDKGRACESNVLIAAGKLNDSLLTGFSKEEQKVMHNYLLGLVGNLEK
jgi:MarR family transcriptional regulator for hemolysin